MRASQLRFKANDRENAVRLAKELEKFADLSGKPIVTRELLEAARNVYLSFPDGFPSELYRVNQKLTRPTAQVTSAPQNGGT